MNLKRNWSPGRPAPWPERFWEKVRKTEGCWLWTASTDTAGYPNIKVNGRLRRASHIAWELTHGLPFPAGGLCCHTCDNPLCVNPTHFFVGTHQDNAADMCAKGRQATGEQSSARLHRHRMRRGEAHPKARLTEAKVREIRQLTASGARVCDLARRFDVNVCTIIAVIQRRTWREI